MARQYVRVELFYQHTESGVTKYAWHNQADPDDSAAAAVYTRDPVSIRHGRGPEQGEPTPSAATLTFKGHTHNPENPASALYGLIGLNTPIRITTGTSPALNDTFTRSTTNGWGGTGALSWALSGGTNPDDWDVNGSEGTITHTDVNVLRYSTVDTGEADHRVRVIFDTSATDITDAAASVWVLGRFTDVNNYYAALISIATNEVMTVGLYKRVAGTLTQIAAPVTVANTGSDATFDMYGELYIEGNRLYASCWRRFSGDESLAWMVSAEDDDLTTGTAAGVTGRRETGNTNANLQLRFHEFTAVPGTIRFCGEVADWRPRRALGGDRWVEVEAGDPLLRLQAPQADALRSALWRENLLNGPVAFWPISDGSNADTAASALPGGAPLSVVATDFSSGLDVPLRWSPAAWSDWIEPIGTAPADTGLEFNGPVDMDSGATEWAGDFVFALDPDSSAGSQSSLVLRGTGAATAGDPRIDWSLSYTEGVGWNFARLTYNPTISGTTVASAALDLTDGRLHHARMVTVRDGADVDWEVFIDGTSVGAGTLAGSAWQTIESVEGITQAGPAGRTAAGFVAVWDTASPPANAANAAVVGRSGELAGDRLVRLLGEEGIAYELIGDAADTEAMGPQLIDTLAANLASIEAVDMGLLHGTRHQVGLTYRTRADLYGQTPVTLDVEAGGEVGDPLEPVIGALGVVNDVTVKRANGSSARSVAETGPLNVNPRSTDPEGVGRYPVDLTLNADLDGQLQGLADWRRHRGTVKAVRYPQVTVLFGALAADGKTALATSVNRLRIGDRVDLANAEPTGVMQLVPGYAETIGPVVAERQITLNGTPANLYDVGIYNATDHKYDSAYSTTGASFVAGTDTSLSVAIEAGRSLWVTGSGSPQFPIDLNVAGCRLRVTAISGASSPQTFTVNATVVNGINKTIPAGTPVRLWTPRRYAL